MAEEEIGRFSPSGIMWRVVIRPENARKVTIPLSAVASGMFAKDGLEGPIKALYHPITLGVVGGCVQLSDPQLFAHIIHDVRE